MYPVAFRRLLRYPMSATIALLTTILDDPADPEAQSDFMALRWFRRLIEKMVDGEGCDLTNLLRGCLAMEKIASTAIADTVDQLGSGHTAERSSSRTLDRSRRVSSYSALEYANQAG